MPNTNYAKQRDRRIPPHVSLRDLRAATGLTLDDVCARMSEAGGAVLTRGGLSGLENGHRGASQDVLDSLASAYGLAPGAIVTDYAPRGLAAAS